MKPIAQDSSTTQPQKILTALILTGIVFVSSGLTLIKNSVAADKRPLPKVAKESVTQNVISDRATLSNGQDSYVYRLKEDGSEFLIKGQNGNNQTLKPVPIPASELPPSLDRNVVFREISSGGITGRTFETVLLNDGRLIRRIVGDANDSGRSVRRVSRQQVRQFQQLLERQRFVRFKNLNYASKTACCDISTHTLTSRDGTVRYNIVPLDALPENLRAVVEAWNQIQGSAREIGR